MANMKEQVNRITDIATDKARDAAQVTKETARDAADKVSDVAGHVADKAQEWAHDAYDQSGEALKHAGDELTQMVRKYPLPAVCIGLAVGFLFGRAMRS